MIRKERVEGMMRRREWERVVRKERVGGSGNGVMEGEHLSLPTCYLVHLQRQREAQAAIPPHEMFRSQTDKYSAFDEQGVPTADAKGQPLGDKQLKKLRKEWEEQKKRYESRST